MRSPGLSPWSYNMLDIIIQLRISWSTQKHVWDISHWDIWRWAYLSERWRQGQGGRRTETEAICSPMLTSPADMIAGKGWDAAFNQTGTAIGLRGVSHTEAGPRVRGKKGIKSHSAPKSTSTWQKISQMLNMATLFPCGLPGSKILTWQFQRAEKNFLTKVVCIHSN